MANENFTLMYPEILDFSYADELCKKLGDRPVIVYGIDIYGLAVMNNLADSGNEIVCFCDPDPFKQTYKHFGISVIAPEKLHEKLTENAAVVIAVMPNAVPNPGEIKKSLVLSGVPEDIIFSLKFKKSERGIPVPINIESTDISAFDKPLLPTEFYKPCAISEEDKISVYMKVYRAPIPYIIRAIQSVREQSYKNLKITLLANDCEPETLVLLQKFAEIDHRIEVLIQPQNIWHIWDPDRLADVKKITAHILSDCDFYCLLDNDDYYAPDFLEKTVEVIRREKSDVVIGGAYLYREAGAVGLYSFSPPFSEKTFEGKVEIADYIVRYGIHTTTIWGKLWSKKAMKLHWDFVTGGDSGDYPIITPETIDTDDFIYTLRILPLLDKISIIPDITYFWTRRNGSYSGAPDFEAYFHSYAVLETYADKYLAGMGNISEKIKTFLVNHLGFYVGLKMFERRGAEDIPSALKSLETYRNSAKKHLGEKPAAAVGKRIDELILKLQ